MKIFRKNMDLVPELREIFSDVGEPLEALQALGFCGGRSVRNVFEVLLQNTDLLPEPCWKQLLFFLVDERIVPKGSEQSNYWQLEKELIQPLEKIGLVTGRQGYPVLRDDLAPADLPANYQRQLREKAQEFLIAFLGVGEDGHIASLFPEDMEAHSRRSELDFLFIENSPKPPPERVSASAEFLLRSKNVFLIFSGSSKKQAWENFNNPEIKPVDCPAVIFRGRPGVSCLVDLD